MKKFLYFQPEYVSRFKCDGNACLDNCCCRPWNIDIDARTYKKYSQVQPPEVAEEILSHIAYDKSKDIRFIYERPCPFLTEKNLCRLQLKYGEKFLSSTCTTYPRRTASENFSSGH